MNRNGATGLLAIGLATWCLAATTAAAQQRFGDRYGTDERQGFFLLLEGGWANPRNTDNVIVTAESSTSLVSILPDWDDDLAYRIVPGYQFANGNRLWVGYWHFETGLNASASAPAGSRFNNAIGPFPFVDNAYRGNTGSPGSFDVTGEIEARTIDLAWGREHEFNESFALEWSAGLRHATFQERFSGSYGQPAGFDPGSGPDLFDKRNRGEMFGVRLGVRGSYRFVRSLSVTGTLAFSMLDGELDASATTRPLGSVGGNPVAPVTATLIDDSRSGTIREVDLQLVWHSTTDGLRVSLGWEQSRWDDISSDLMRNLPGTTVGLRDRDSVTFSSWKLGFWVLF